MPPESRVSPSTGGMNRGSDDDRGSSGGCCGYGIFFRQFDALVRKNALSKRRTKLQLVRIACVLGRSVQLFFPVGCVVHQ